MQVSNFPAIFKANFGHFRCVSTVFRPVSAVSAAGRYDPIWPIRPDSGRISPVRRESKPIRRELSRVGANLRKKKKNAEAAPTRGQPRRTPRPASRRVRHGCDTLPATSVHSSLFVSVMKVKLIVPCSFFWFETKKKRKKRERERERNQRCIH